MKDSLYVFLFFFTTNIIAQTTDTVFQKIYFDFDEYEITTNGDLQLQSILTDKRTIQKIFIEANTDHRGSIEYNIKLGSNRANATKERLSELGLDNRLITILNYGESKPLFENSTENGMARNRRVDIMVLYHNANDLAKVEKDKVEIPDYSNDGLYDFLDNNDFEVAHLYDKIAPMPQQFVVSSDRDTILVTKSGVIIEIPNLAFKCDCDDEMIELSIREGVTYEQMLTQKFVTIDEIGEPLQTGGMIDITAKTSSGKEVKLQNDFTINIPTAKPIEEMQFFTGQNQTFTDVYEATGEEVVREEQRWTQVESKSITETTFRTVPQNGKQFCCTPDCVLEEDENIVNKWKKEDKQAYEVYIKSIELAKLELIENCKKIKERQRAALQSFENQGLASNIVARDYYQFSLSSFRPVNVDIYLSRSNTNLVSISTTIPIHPSINYFYINKKDKYIIPGSDYNKVFKVPKGKDITILGLAVNRDGELMLGLKQVKATRDKVYDLKFQQVSKSELKQLLATLDQK